MQRYINDIEWYANFEAWNVIVCSQYMKNEIKGLFQVPKDKINIIKNGVNPDNYKANYSKKFRNLYVADDEKMIFYVGRIVREKGIQVLIQSIPDILEDEPGTKCVIAGKGPFLTDLKKQASYLGIEDRIYFTGFVSDRVRNKLYQVADLAVFPSLYEPFGIVVLEAMTTKTPVVVSDVGGMTEFVKDEENGIKVEPGNPSQLAGAIKALLHNRKKAKLLASKGYEMAKNEYNWDKIAKETVNVYQKVLKEYTGSDWNMDDNRIYTAKEEKKEAFAGYRYM
jgi:glycosyltransferase involved in cell wall biosynthesis